MRRGGALVIVEVPLSDSTSRPSSSRAAVPPTAPDDGRWLLTLRDEVQPVTFKKGRQYAEGRRVLNLARSKDRLAAEVVGSESRYAVEAWPGEGKVASRCSCESHDKYGPHCKHVVALALVYLARLKAAGTAVSPGAASAPQSAPAVATGEGSPGEAAAGALREAPLDAVGLPGLAKLESWLGLSALPDHEFTYRLAPSGPGTGRHWLVDVRRQDAQAKGPVHVKRTLSQGLRIAPADERIFLELSRHEHRYDARVVLSDEDLAEVMELLRPRRVIYRGTPLQFMDDPARPQVKLESRADGATATLEVLLPGGQSLGLKDVIVLGGRVTWVLVGQSVHRLEPAFPPRLLRKWLLEPQMSFPPGQLDRVLTFFAAHLPRFRMALRADGLEVDEKTEPRFVLTVEGTPDRVKAQLAARYGKATVPVAPQAQHLGYALGGDGQGRKLYRRREEAERAAGKRLLEGGFRFDAGSGAYEAAGDAALEFWARGVKGLPGDWEAYGATAEKVKLRPALRPRVRVGMSGVNWFELEAEFVTDDQAVDLGAVRMWLDSGRRFIPLRDGTFAEADREALKRAADLLEEAGALPGAKATRLPLHSAAALELLSELGEFSEMEGRARAAIAELKAEHGVPPIPKPEGVEAELRHYQEAGISWLWFLERHGLCGILADDMGLGKTLQALSLLQKARNVHGQKPSLVVAPTSVLPNWQREAERFTPGLKAVVWHGQDRKEKAEALKGVDLVLTSYALARRDLEELSKVGFRYVVLDEAQNIKNAGSATAQACKAIPAEHRLALTGTPLENRLSELWSLFDFLMPGFLGGPDTFHDRYEHPIQVQGDAAVRDRLRRRIQPFILRRLKTEVAKDLPPRTETVAFCEMDPGQAALYREVLEESRRKVYDSIDKVGFGRSKVSILAALMKLRQVCCDPRLLKLPPGTQLPPSGKLERFNALVEELVGEGHRALVFSQFTEMLELLKTEADQKRLGYLYLDGRTRDRMARVDEFNNPAGPPLFFISLKAGGTGLNLTAADYVIHYDPWWNPAVEDQATDRAHRIGQTRAVIAYKLITRGTVEEKILALQKRKRELAAGVLSAEGEFGKTLTETDVEELFRDDL